MKFITKDVPKLDEPQFVQVGLPPAFDGCRLNTTFADGTTKSLRISKIVAAVLIAQGTPYEG